MYLRFLLFLFLVAASVPVSGQQDGKTALVKGRLEQASGEPATNVQLSIPWLRMVATSDETGSFSFAQVPFGSHNLVIQTGQTADTIRILVNREVIDLSAIQVDASGTPAGSVTSQIPTITLEDNNVSGDDEGVASQSVSGLLSASRDPFLNAAGYTWSPFWFSPRGYEQNQQQVLINGLTVNDAETGDAFWSQWGGLNDIFRASASTYGLQPSEYAFGGATGTVGFNINASAQRKQTRITYSVTNRLYRNRLMFTKSSGWTKGGWAYSVSLSKRWAKEGYVEGTFYDGYSYYAGVSKKVNESHTLHLSAFGAPTRRGKAAPTYQEAYDLAGSNFYNPNWGYQDGEKRNARVSNSHQPVFVLSHEFTPSGSLHWSTSLAYQAGKNRNSGIDWYNAPDPRPDYYKYLPSYYLLGTPPDSAAALDQLHGFQANQQINWNELYQANYLNVQTMPNPDGTPGTESGRRSVYVLGQDVDDLKKWNFNTNLQKVFSPHLTFHTGVNFVSQKTESYKELTDLLGGDYYLNINSFNERNAGGDPTLSQNDLNNPNKILKVGDKYVYDYIIRLSSASWWGQGVFTYNNVDFFVAGSYGYTSFEREGVFRNGLFAAGNESYGKAYKQKFAIYGLKGGITYKFNGRNYIFLNAGISADAPSVDNTYYAVRIRNATTNSPRVQKNSTMELGYLLHAPKLRARVVGYVSGITEQVIVQRSFYTGAGSSNSFVSAVMEHVDTRSTGIELGFDYKLSAALSLMGAAAMGQSFFTNDAIVTLHSENTPDINPRSERAYIKNLYLGVGPQTVYTLGINYRSPKYWYANLSYTHLSRNYVDISSLRRTSQTVDLLTPGSPQWNAVVGQEEFKPQSTVDLFFGKSFLLSRTLKALPRNTYLYVNIGINNLLDNQDIRSGGFENPRFDYAGGVAGKFGAKYFYATGRNYFVNLVLKF